MSTEIRMVIANETSFDFAFRAESISGIGIGKANKVHWTRPPPHHVEAGGSAEMAIHCNTGAGVSMHVTYGVDKDGEGQREVQMNLYFQLRPLSSHHNIYKPEGVASDDIAWLIYCEPERLDHEYGNRATKYVFKEFIAP